MNKTTFFLLTVIRVNNVSLLLKQPRDQLVISICSIVFSAVLYLLLHCSLTLIATGGGGHSYHDTPNFSIKPGDEPRARTPSFTRE